MRIGLMIGADEGRYRQKVAQLVADAEAAEQAGFSLDLDAAGSGDFDAFTAITLMGQATERIELGTAVAADPDASSDRHGAGDAVEPGGVRRPLHARPRQRRTTGSSRTCSASRTSGRPTRCATTSRS